MRRGKRKKRKKRWRNSAEEGNRPLLPDDEEPPKGGYFFARISGDPSSDRVERVSGRMNQCGHATSAAELVRRQKGVDMKGSNGIEVAQMRRLEGDRKTKAFCDVAVSGFVIRGFRVVDGKRGLFVGMPRQQGKDGKWYDTVQLPDEQIRMGLSELILEAYAADEG